MKQILLIIMLMCSSLLCGAQAISMTVDNQTPGWLSSKINYGDQQTVENLAVTGFVNQKDLTFIGTLMAKHSLKGHLDLTNVKIVDTEYADGFNSITSVVNKTKITMFRLGLGNDVELRRFSLPITLPEISPYLLAHVKADTLDYGSNYCNTLEFLLTTNRSEPTNISPKVLIIRDGVSKIGRFYDSYGDTKENLQKIILPQTIDSIGEKAFMSCENLSEINLPDGIHTIGKYAFSGTMFKPDTLRLPSKLKIFYTKSFSKKPGQVIVIPNNTEVLDNTEGTYGQGETGIGRTDKYSIIINQVRPPKFVTLYYTHDDLSSCDLYVPKEGVSLYRNKYYNSNEYGKSGNPYSYAKIFSIAVPIERIVLNYTSCNLNVGNMIDLLPTIQPSNADDPSVTWQSSNANIAKVSQNGRVTALSSGKATIKVTSKENPNIFATCEVVVRQPLQSISLTPASVRIEAGEVYDGLTVNYDPLTADNKKVTWQSSDNSIAVVDDNGKITAIKGGEVIVKVTSEENNAIYAECTVTVVQPVTGVSMNKTAIELTEDESEQLFAIVLPENATNKNVNWSSSDLSVAMVSPNGIVYAIKPGQATIMVTTADGGYAALCKVTVKAKATIATALNLSAKSASIKVGETLRLEATLSPDNVTNKKIDWTSTNLNVATVDTLGLVKALAEGETQIIATTTDGSNLSAKCLIIVSNESGVETILKEENPKVRIYNMSGSLLFEGLYSQAKLKQGVYIVLHNAKALKIIVK